MKSIFVTLSEVNISSLDTYLERCLHVDYKNGFAFGATSTIGGYIGGLSWCKIGKMGPVEGGGTIFT